LACQNGDGAKVVGIFDTEEVGAFT
jgi:hypothetical protein